LPCALCLVRYGLCAVLPHVTSSAGTVLVPRTLTIRLHAPG
jgi:hypothetical protein